MKIIAVMLRSPQLLVVAERCVVAYSAVLPVVTVAMIAESWGYGYADAGWALAGAAVFLPIHVGHVRRALRGESASRGGRLGLLVMVVAIGALLPVVEAPWLSTLGTLAASLLLVLRPPWSAVLAGAVVVATVPLALALADRASMGDAAALAHWYTSVVVFRCASLVVLVWLVVSLRRLHGARAALAADAVLHERLRIDGELRATVGTELEAIAASGQRIADRARVDAAMVDAEPGALRSELQGLVDRARRTLAQARRLASGYQRSTLDTELDLAVSLLRAAGIDAAVERPVDPAGRPAVVDGERQAALAADLRARLAAVLRDDAVRRCVIAVTVEPSAVGAGGVRLEVRTDVSPVLSGADRSW